jgi:hypothetical protein
VAGVPENDNRRRHHPDNEKQKQPPSVTQEAAVSIRTRQPPTSAMAEANNADEHPVE